MLSQKLRDRIKAYKAMTIAEFDDGWWIINVPSGCEEMGPYKTRKEAKQTRKGIVRTMVNYIRIGRSYITTTPNERIL